MQAEVIKFEVGKVYEAVGGGLFVKVLARKSAHSLFVSVLDADGELVPDGQLVASTVDSTVEENTTFRASLHGIRIQVSVYASDEADLDAVLERARKRRERYRNDMLSKATALRERLLAAGVSVKAAYDVYTILSEAEDAVVMKMFSMERLGESWEGSGESGGLQS